MVRKGLFTQLPYLYYDLEPQMRMSRTVLDYALYDVTGDKQEARQEVYEWLHPTNEDFKECCLEAGLRFTNVYNTFVFFLERYFPHYADELYCYQNENGGIVKFSSEFTLLGSQTKLNNH